MIQARTRVPRGRRGCTLPPASSSDPAGSGVRTVEVKRLCLVVPEFRTDGGRSGGLDSVAQFVLDAFSPANGWTVEVASPRASHRAPESLRLSNPRSWFAARERDTVVDGLPIHYFGAYVAEFEVARYLPRTALTRFLDRFDAVLVVAGSPAIVNAVSRTRRPVVAQVATFVREERRQLIARAAGVRRARVAAMTRLVSALDERGLRVPRVVLVENLHMLHECQARGLNVELVPPGVDCDLYHPSPSASRSPFILAVGRWGDPRKDLPTLLQAFALCRRRDGIEQRLVLAGLRGPDAHDREMISALGLEDVVEIRENVPVDELAELYRSADIFALSSTEEGLGLVFLEAMASGTPIVATATEGAQYALGNAQAGELVPLGRDLVDRFASVLSRWCTDAAFREKARPEARENVMRRFNAIDSGARFRQIVEESLVGEP